MIIKHSLMNQKEKRGIRLKKEQDIIKAELVDQLMQIK